MKKALKIIVSALLAPVVMLLVLFVTGFMETVFQADIITWLLEIFICILLIPLLLLLERKMKLGELSLACNGAYFISAALFGIFVLPHMVEAYATEYYEIVNAWDTSTFLKGVQWVLYQITVYAQVVLHLIIRIIIAIVTRVRAERKIVDKEKYGDEE